MVLCYSPRLLLLQLVALLVSTQAAPQMERMGQPIADAYQAVDNVVGKALNVVFQLSSWFTEYETAPYTLVWEEDGLEKRLYPARKWVCTKKTSSLAETDPKSGMFWSLFQYIQGANSLEASIEMTTPVATLVEKDMTAGTITYEMCFYIGAAHEDNTPTPTNTRVYIKEEPEKKIFTRQVGGWMDTTKWEDLSTILADYLLILS